MDRDRDFIGTREYRPNPANGVSGLNRGRLGRQAPGWCFWLVAGVYEVAIVAAVVWFNWPTIRAWWPW